MIFALFKSQIEPHRGQNHEFAKDERSRPGTHIIGEHQGNIAQVFSHVPAYFSVVGFAFLRAMEIVLAVPSNSMP